jgi:hypothetical protein
MEGIERPKRMFLRQIAGLEDQCRINRQYMQSRPITLEFLS